MHTLHAINAKDNGIIDIDLVDYLPHKEWVNFDITQLLYERVMVKEKIFKEELSKLDLEQFSGKCVVVDFDKDLILPSWVFMLLSAHIGTKAEALFFSSLEEAKIRLWEKNLENTNFDELKNKKVVIVARPGMPAAIYAKITTLLLPQVKTLMYGEKGLPKVIWKNK